MQHSHSTLKTELSFLIGSEFKRDCLKRSERCLLVEVWEQDLFRAYSGFFPVEVQAYRPSLFNGYHVRQNLFGAFFYNTLGLPVAMGALYPFFGILLSPIIAGAAMAFSSVTVVTNANRLRAYKMKSS